MNYRSHNITRRMNFEKYASQQLKWYIKFNRTNDVLFWLKKKKATQMPVTNESPMFLLIYVFVSLELFVVTNTLFDFPYLRK